MIVDNHASAREAIRDLLQGPGIVIRECASGTAAVEAAREFEPDWIIMDLHMPGLNGLEASALIRKEFPLVRIVILSFEDEPNLRRAAQDIGVVAYIAKEHFPKLRELIFAGDAKFFFPHEPNGMN
jgi:DNA-binding NarL/FixJ family response regulator